jgi:hypothetical protein
MVRRDSPVASRIASPLVAAVATALAAGCRCGSPPPPARPGAPPVVDHPALLATIPGPATAAGAASPRLTGLHVSPADSGPEFHFSESGGGVAFVLEQADGARVFHDGTPGPRYDAVGPPAVSPDGRRVAHGALVDGAWRMVVDGVPGAPWDTVEAPRFSPDGAHLAYLALRGERWHLVVDAVANPGTTARITRFGFTGDSARIACIEDADGADVGRLVVSDLAFRTPTTLATRASDLVLAEAGPGLGAVLEEPGGQRVMLLDPGRPAAARRGEVFDAVGGLVVRADGGSVAYLAERGGRGLVVRDGETEPQAADEGVAGPLVFLPREKGVGLLSWTPRGVVVRQFFGAGPPAGGPWEQAEGLAYDPQGSSYALVARRGDRWFAVVDGREGPPFERAVTPAFSPDGRRLVYRAREAGRRFVVVAGRDGAVLRRSPDFEQVFPVRFTADGRSIAYGVKDGAQLRWMVEAL